MEGTRVQMPADFEEAYTVWMGGVCGWASCLVAQPDFVCFCISNSKTFLSHEQGKVGILIIKPEPNRETMTHAERQAKLRQGK
jgi:hypothetical protein